MKFLLILIATFQLSAETIHPLLSEPGRFKVSGGLLLHWKVKANASPGDAIEAFDRYGARVLGIDVYKLLPLARMVSIDDVAVRRNESIAVASVSRESDDRTRAWLLQLSWDGRLAHITQLDAAKSLGWIDFDEAGNIWGLTDYLGEKVRKDTIYNGTPCPPGSLILVFNPEGKIFNSLLKQADFPDSLREAPDIGQVSFGLSKDGVWFWQPARHKMVITDREGRDVRTVSIPRARTGNLGGQTLLLPTGEVIQDLRSPTPGVRGIYLADTHQVKKIDQPRHAFLVGMDGSDLLFLSQADAAGDLLVTRITSLTELENLGTPVQPPAAGSVR